MARALVNARIHVMDDPEHVESALLEQDGRIILVGSDEEVSQAAKQAGATIEDMQGRVVLPGFVDAHMHFLHVGVKQTRPDLAGATSRQEALDRVRQWLARHPGTGPVTAEGWDEAEWHGDDPPTLQELDVLAPARPLVLRRICGHKSVANSLALAVVQKRWSDPEKTLPDGVLLEEPSLFLNEVLPEDPHVLDRALRVACAEAHRLGVTTIGDFEQAPLREALKRGVSSGALSVRVNCSIYPQQLDAALKEGFQTGRIPEASPMESLNTRASASSSEDIFHRSEGSQPADSIGGPSMMSPSAPNPSGTSAELAQGESSPQKPEANTPSRQPGGVLLRDGGMKVFLDGSIGGHTALLLEPYSDRPDTKGTQIWTDEQLDDLYNQAHDNKIQLMVHVIGDGAVEQGLQAFERLAKRVGVDAIKAMRHRFEHYEIVHDDQVQRTAALGLVPCSQPNFVGVWSSKGGLYEERLGPRFANNNRFQTFKAAGIRLSFGSDGMPFGPLVGLQSAVYHPDPKERMSPQEAIWHYTKEAAWSLHREDEVGTLETGKLADWIVLDQTTLDSPPKQWTLMETVMAGTTV